MSLDTYNEQPKFKDILQQLPVTLQLQLQLATTLTRAHKTFVEFGLLNITLQQERAFDSVLSMLSSQIDSVESNAANGKHTETDTISLLDLHFPEWDHFFITASRLEIVAMHFYKSSTLDVQSCSRIFNTTVKMMEFIRDQEMGHVISSSCTRFVFATVLMGCTLMLRILKGPYAANVDQEQGAALLLTSRKFMQSYSVTKGDHPDRAAQVAKQIWESEKLFKDANGTVNFTLRVRNRLSAGPLHDLIHRLRENFLDVGNQPAPSRSAGMSFCLSAESESTNTSCQTTYRCQMKLRAPMIHFPQVSIQLL
jgi:transcriptional regulatory protein LEU3